MNEDEAKEVVAQAEAEFYMFLEKLILCCLILIALILVTGCSFNTPKIDVEERVLVCVNDDVASVYEKVDAKREQHEIKVECK